MFGHRSINRCVYYCYRSLLPHYGGNEGAWRLKVQENTFAGFFSLPVDRAS
jgi:hypothetical protein